MNSTNLYDLFSLILILSIHSEFFWHIQNKQQVSWTNPRKKSPNLPRKKNPETECVQQKKRKPPFYLIVRFYRLQQRHSIHPESITNILITFIFTMETIQNWKHLIPQRQYTQLNFMTDTIITFIKIILNRDNAKLKVFSFKQLKQRIQPISISDTRRTSIQTMWNRYNSKLRIFSLIQQI